MFGSLLSAHSGNKANETNLEIAKMNNEFNEKMMERQMEYNTEMWNKQNDYNSAASQVQRYRDAGLNPYLMMNGQGAGTAATASGINPPTADQSGRQIPVNYDMSGIGNAAALYYQRQKDLSEIRKTVAEAEGIETDNLTRMQLRKAELMEIYSRTRDRNVRLEIDKIMRRADLEMMNADFRKKMTENQLLEQQAEGQRLDNIAKSINNEHLPLVLKVGIAQTVASAAATWAQKHLTDKQAEHEVEKIIETQARSRGYKIDNATKRDTAEQIIKGMILDNKKKAATFDTEVKAANMRNERDYSIFRTHRLLQPF